MTKTAATGTVAFLTGKPLRPGSVLAELHTRFRSLGSHVAVHVLGGGTVLPSSLSGSTLIVQRTLGLAQLSAAQELEHAGVRCCNQIGATMAVTDRGATLRALALAGVRVPATTLAATWHHVVERADDAPLVVKAATEFSGRGRGVLKAANGRLPLEAPFDGPYLVQEYVAGDGRDYKVYVVGEQVRGLIKWRSPNEEPQVAPFDVDEQIADISRHVGQVLQLEIYGVDFLVGPNGPVVVDVNPFPGFRGVPRAAETIVNYLMTL
jgi:ribosomal protein S6--L-glutamate ligase